MRTSFLIRTTRLGCIIIRLTMQNLLNTKLFKKPSVAALTDSVEVSNGASTSFLLNSNFFREMTGRRSLKHHVKGKMCLKKHRDNIQAVYFNISFIGNNSHFSIRISPYTSTERQNYLKTRIFPSVGCSD